MRSKFANRSRWEVTAFEDRPRPRPGNAPVHGLNASAMLARPDRPVSAPAAPSPQPSPATSSVQLLGLNDFHGHLEANTPGTITPVARGRRVSRPAGPSTSRLTSAPRPPTNPNTLVVSAGDLDRRVAAPVGAVPRRAVDRGDERDRARPERRGQPRVRRGRGRAPAHAERRLPPGRRLPGRRRLRRRGLRLPGGERRSDEDSGEPIFPPYAIRRFDGIKVGFIGMTLEGTPDIVSPSGVAGLDFLDEAETANRYARRAAPHARRARDRGAAARGRGAVGARRDQRLQRDLGADRGHRRADDVRPWTCSLPATPTRPTTA